MPLSTGDPESASAYGTQLSAYSPCPAMTLIKIPIK